MRPKGLLLGLCLLFAPLLAGCFGEDLEVALHVKEGETYRISGERHVDGTVLVSPGGTLILEDADLVIAQALVVAGSLVATDSDVTFMGRFERRDLEVSGAAAFNESRIMHARSVNALDGAITITGGSVDAQSVRVRGGSLVTENVDWDVTTGNGRDQGDGGSFHVESGTLAIQNGTLEVHQAEAFFRVDGGKARLSNLTLDLQAVEGDVLDVHGGELHLANVSATVRHAAPFLHVDDGLARLLDAPLPRNARPPTVIEDGRLEVAWTLTVRAVAPPGNLPVGGLPVTLTSAHDPTTVSARGVTDGNGEARLEALQYAIHGGGTRSGNPHAVRAEGGGKHGAAPAVVVEGPMTLLLPVVG